MTEHLQDHEMSNSQPEAAAEQTHTERQHIHAEHAPQVPAEAQPSLETVRLEAQVQAIKSEQIISSREERPPHETPAFASRQLKTVARKRLLKQTRQHLSRPQQALSYVIHQPAVEAVSEVSSKTVARPSGLLSGGVCALIGSSTLLYIDKQYGFRYNFLLWAMLFVGGFALGLFLEFIVFIVRRKRA